MIIYPENLPGELKKPISWTLWRRETRDGKPAKVPYRIDGVRAKSNLPASWCQFDTAFKKFQEDNTFDGICWMMPIDPGDIAFIDIDHCIENGVIASWAQEVIDKFNSYTEKSQSGNGLHILIKGKKPIKRCRKNGSPYEIYDCLRPCYLTGDVVEGHKTIELRQEALDELFEKVFAEEMKQARQVQAQTPLPIISNLSDEALYLKAKSAAGGAKFEALWRGSTSEYGNDNSAADMALMNMLAFWTGGNAVQMERMFSGSGLGQREKWRDRPDYRQRTIKKAIEDAREFYNPNQGQSQNKKEQPGWRLTIQDLTKAKGRKKRVNPETGEFEADPETGEDMIPDLTLSPTKASMAILNALPLRRSLTDTAKDPAIWRFETESGIWRPDGEEVVADLINLVAGDLSYERGRQETFKRLRGMAERVAFDSDPCLLPALDGVVNLKTGEVSEHGPDVNFTFRYGAEIKGEADIRPSLWLLCSSLPDPRDVLTALDICAEAVIRRPSDSIIQLIGAGSNGKGMFERMISALVTDDRISNITLSEAKASRFGPGAVLGKDLWILSEVEEVKPAINLLKKVATGERMDSDIKYGGRIQGKPHVLPLLDCNNAIDFGDDSWGRKRRMVKLDFPFTFDYASGTRRRDPHLEERLTAPAALAGLLKIIIARAPHLIDTKRIYNRKRPEDMAEEYQRQQYSLHYFCEECLTTKKEDAPPTFLGDNRLTTTNLYEEYKEYCRLFHVPVPAEKGQIGKYIKEKFGISSVVTREKNDLIRYYPGLWLAKSATAAHNEISLSYDSYSSYTLATAKLQEENRENSISSLLATAATDKWPKEVITEIERMFKFIESCENPQEISFDKYLQKCCNTVAAVAKGQQIAISGKSAVAKGQSAVATTVAETDSQVYQKMEIDGREETPTPTTAPAPAPDQPPAVPSEETDPIWQSIDAKLRKMGRKDGAGRRGLAVCDLEPGEPEFLRGEGWTEEAIEVSGLRILWAPAKSPEGGA